MTREMMYDKIFRSYIVCLIDDDESQTSRKWITAKRIGIDTIPINTRVGLYASGIRTKL